MNKFFFLLALVFASLLPLLGQSKVRVGAAHFEQYETLLKGKRVGLVVNQTAQVDGTHLVDYLLKKGIKIERIFAPEHGFRGEADAGATVNNARDVKTGIPITSLYGKNKRPTPTMLKNIDILVFDIQDVGVRFYTFISTLHYVMDACASNHLPLVVLDRPNPNGNYVDGPVLDTAFSSFVGMDPIPIVHGLTVGELAKMINGEGWLKARDTCMLTVIPVTDWSHADAYSLPVKPSPNLPNDLSIRLYPSLCLLEATDISIGRGTLFPFQCLGCPNRDLGSFSFTPKSIVGMSSQPKHLNVTCYGSDFRSLDSLNTSSITFTLQYLMDAYRKFPDKEHFVTNKRLFNLLAGNDVLIQQLENGTSMDSIKASWEPALSEYKQKREHYLMYPE